MCRMKRLLATLAAPALLVFASTLAVADDRTAGATATSGAQTGAPQPASAQARIEAQRLPVLARAAFWAREVEVAPRDPVAGANLANALRAIGRIEEAQAAADQVLIVHPNDLEALLEAVRARLARNQGFYAIDLAHRAQMIAPTDWRATGLLAIAFEQSEREAEALAAHSTAVALAPRAAAPLANLAMFRAGRGDLPGAETLLRQAVLLPDAGVQVRLNLALVLGLQGRLEEAETLTRRDLPPDMANNNVAWLREALAKPQAGGRSYESLRTAGS
jgi:Flp pilus assembly protein TadD